MCNAFTPDCGYDNSTIILIGDVFCPNTKCLCTLCLHKKTFQSLDRSNYQCPQCGSVCQVRNFFLKIKQITFSCRLVKDFTFLKEPKIISRCYCGCMLSWQVLFHRREMRIYCRLCSNSEIPFWLWKVWSLIVCSQGSFYVTRTRKDDKNKQNAFFLC